MTTIITQPEELTGNLETDIQILNLRMRRATSEQEYIDAENMLNQINQF